MDPVTFSWEVFTSTAANNIFSIIGIIVGIITLVEEYRSHFLTKIYSTIKRQFSKLSLIEMEYYTHDFVKNKIKQSKKIVRVICVRNIRMTEPDIIEEFRKFILERNGTIEILVLSPNLSNEILSEIMPILPNAPKTVQNLREEICINYNHVFNLHEDLGVKKAHLHIFEYKSLPLIHMCQFDDMIYLGFQLHHKVQVEGSLLDYCIEIPAKTSLGEKILEQFEYLKNEKSEDLFKSQTCKVYFERKSS